MKLYFRFPALLAAILLLLSVTAFAPLTPGVSYEVWLAGHNSRGDGPESNRVTFTA